jgi:tetratricopeptide (TPR) repeat protein
MSLFDAARQTLAQHDGLRALALIAQSLLLEGDRQGDAIAVQGACLREANFHSAALDALRAAAPRYPDNGQVQFQYAMAAHDLGFLDEAQAAFERAILLLPERPEPHMGLADVLLMGGHWSRGWEELEWRYATEEGKKILCHFDPDRRWNGEPVQGKRLLVYGEQGFGDSIQFCRHIKQLRSLEPRQIIVGTSPELTRLFKGVEGYDVLTQNVPPGDAYDLHTPLSSLPRLLKVTPDSLKAETSYISVDPAIRATWRERLAPLPRPRIGLAWQGRPTHPRNHRRSMSLLAFDRLAAHGSFVNVSPVRYSQAELNAAGSSLKIREFGKKLKDFADTAALLSELDLVISVDTGVAHLAGALGRPLWLLLPYTPDWRWMWHREDSPWYPNARLFRQPTPQDWDTVLARVDQNLTSWKATWTKPPEA